MFLSYADDSKQEIDFDQNYLSSNREKRGTTTQSIRSDAYTSA